MTTGNIKIISASWATICGEIEFETNFTRKRFKLSVAIGQGLKLREHGKDRFIDVDRDKVLEIIRQGDDAMWDWRKFLAMWEGWAAGFEAARDKYETTRS